MAIHTEYWVRVKSAYPATTRRSPLLPASARKTPRRRLATGDYRRARRGPMPRAANGSVLHVPPRVSTGEAGGPPGHEAMTLATAAVPAAVSLGSVCGMGSQLEMAELMAPSRGHGADRR